MNFIDFCAGIGGGRLGLTDAGYKCLAFSEIESKAVETYRLLHRTDENNYGDLTKIDTKNLIDFDLLIGGFPCQTFSIAGDRCGLDDIERGQVIFYLAKILKEKNTKYFILENVKGLMNHDKGRTFQKILTLLSSIGYRVYYKLLNSIDFGLTHMRERVYFVGIRKDLDNKNNFIFPKKNSFLPRIEDFLIDEDESLIFNENSKTYATFIKYLNNKYNQNRYKIEELLKKEYQVIDTRQSDLRLYENKVPTIRKGRQGILYVKNGTLRKFSGFEALLLQGFSVDYANKVKDKISNTQLLSLSGNAMSVNVIEAIGKELKNYIESL